MAMSLMSFRTSPASESMISPWCASFRSTCADSGSSNSGAARSPSRTRCRSLMSGSLPVSTSMSAEVSMTACGMSVVTLLARLTNGLDNRLAADTDSSGSPSVGALEYLGHRRPGRHGFQLPLEIGGQRQMLGRGPGAQDRVRLLVDIANLDGSTHACILALVHAVLRLIARIGLHVLHDHDGHAVGDQGLVDVGDVAGIGQVVAGA